VAQAAGEPFDGGGEIFEAATVAGGPVPAAQAVARSRQLPDDVSAQKARGPRYRNEHRMSPAGTSDSRGRRRRPRATPAKPQAAQSIAHHAQRRERFKAQGPEAERPSGFQ